MAKALLKASPFLLMIVLGSCSAVSPMVSVVRGNLAYVRGEFQAALVHYLDTEVRRGDRSWLLFNIGNVYYALGEHDAALASWQEAMQRAAGNGSRTAQTAAMIYVSAFNRGVLFYERGLYQEAHDEFRYALEVNSRSVAAKTNVELALLRRRAAEEARRFGPVSPESRQGDVDTPQTVRILEYIRRKEAQRWHANRDADQLFDQRDW